MREVLSETGEEQFLVATNFLTTMIQHTSKNGPWETIITSVKISQQAGAELCQAKV